MSFSQFHRFYGQADFAALGAGTINFPVLHANILAATAAEPPSLIEQTSINSVHLVWDPGAPAQSVLDASDAVVAAHVGALTTSQPFVATNNGPVTANSATPVSVIDLMQAAVAGERAQAISITTVSGGPARTQTSHTPLADTGAYNGSATFNILAGQTVRIQLQIAEIGGAAGVAEMTQARATIDKVG
jgi:hypothetical protein